jgi:DNA-binding Lrp family transcriptional regulator
MARLAGATGQMILPTLKRYKLKVRFPLSTGRAEEPDESDPSTNAPVGRPGSKRAAPPEVPLAAPTSADTPRRPAMTEADRHAIRALQVDLPNIPEPLAELAGAEGMDLAALLDAAASLRRTGRLRRYAGVVRHRQAGAAANVMVAWQSDNPDAAGHAAATEDAISHCYLRPARPGWPYVLYTMVHGSSRPACLAVIDRLARRPEMGPHRALWTRAELAKKRARLFTADERAWEDAHPADCPPAR